MQPDSIFYYRLPFCFAHLSSLRSLLSLYLSLSTLLSPKSQISPGWKNLPSDPVPVPGVAAVANPGRASLLWDAMMCTAGPRLRPRVIFEREFHTGLCWTLLIMWPHARLFQSSVT